MNQLQSFPLPKTVDLNGNTVREAGQSVAAYQEFCPLGQGTHIALKAPFTMGRGSDLPSESFACWCQFCGRSWAEPDSIDNTPEVMQLYALLQEAAPVTKRPEKRPPLSCPGCSSVPHVERASDPKGECWVAVCFNCGWRTWYGFDDVCELILFDVIRDKNPSFPGRTVFTRLTAWVKGKVSRGS